MLIIFSFKSIDIIHLKINSLFSVNYWDNFVWLWPINCYAQLHHSQDSGTPLLQIPIPPLHDYLQFHEHVPCRHPLALHCFVLVCIERLVYFYTHLHYSKLGIAQVIIYSMETIQSTPPQWKLATTSPHLFYSMEQTISKIIWITLSWPQIGQSFWYCLQSCEQVHLQNQVVCSHWQWWSWRLWPHPPSCQQVWCHGY